MSESVRRLLDDTIERRTAELLSTTGSIKQAERELEVLRGRQEQLRSEIGDLRAALQEMAR